MSGNEQDIKVTLTREGEEVETEERDDPTVQEVEEEAGGEVTDWRAEAEKHRDLFVRTQADMENMKKRLTREKEGVIKYANEELIKELLPQLDNLERALEHSGPSSDALAEGVRMTYEGIMNVLAKFGLERIPSKGEKFDPNLHEAVMQREDPDAEPGVVLEEIQKGYSLRGRLIRPAMVIVAQAPAGAGAE